ncbi:MAG: hypothetical protein IJQ47_08445 [Synergistaceae bacterium]|nr:hypothetical protein [Synergistaceae bacterium]
MFLQFIKFVNFLCKSHKDEIKKQKIKFLYQQAFNYYYDVEELNYATGKVVELPFAKEKTAHNKATKALLKIIADGRINELYTKRIKQLKELGLK